MRTRLNNHEVVTIARTFIFRWRFPWRCVLSSFLSPLLRYALIPSRAERDVSPFPAIFCNHFVLPNEGRSRYHIYLVYRNYAIFWSTRLLHWQFALVPGAVGTFMLWRWTKGSTLYGKTRKTVYVNCIVNSCAWVCSLRIVICNYFVKYRYLQSTCSCSFVRYHNYFLHFL